MALPRIIRQLQDRFTPACSDSSGKLDSRSGSDGTSLSSEQLNPPPGACAGLGGGSGSVDMWSSSATCPYVTTICCERRAQKAVIPDTRAMHTGVACSKMAAEHLRFFASILLACKSVRTCCKNGVHALSNASNAHEETLGCERISASMLKRVVHRPMRRAPAHLTLELYKNFRVKVLNFCTIYLLLQTVPRPRRRLNLQPYS
jgi:hypothetical protein